MIDEGALLWSPPADRANASELSDFVRWLEQRRGLGFPDYERLWQWSIDRPEEFWDALWDYFDILSDTRFEQVSSGPEMILTRWFQGARVNYAEHLLRREADAPADEIAFVHGSESRALAALSWHELGARVRSVATQLRRLGIQPGDCIVSYMPNVIETAVAMIASVAIGAVWSSAAPEFGSATVIERFAQIRPRLMFAADGYRFGGKAFDRREELANILAALPDIRTVVWLPYLGLAEPQLSGPFQVVPWSDVVATAGPPRAQFEYERVPHDHPLWVLYSSGTTGLPKAITHSHVGMVLDQLKQMRLHLDLKPGKRMFFYTTTGWMMWNSVLSALLAGASAVLYDGSPAWPNIDSLWDLAEQTQTTAFGASPTLVQMMQKAGVQPKDTRRLDKLDTLILGGAPSNAATFEWFYEHVKQDVWVLNTSGGTDLCGALVSGVATRNVHAGEIQGKVLGIAVEAWSDAGRAVIDEVGELVVTRPFPSMPLFLWGDRDNARYRDTYFSHFPGVWRHGDFIKINARGGCYIYGRADATLNRFGVRIGTSEIYRVVNGVPGVVDSIIICCETGDGGFFMPLFVQLTPGRSLDAALIETISQRLRRENSPRHVPDQVLQVPSIPYTLTGKKMEVPLRKIIMGADVRSVAKPDAMADAGAIDWYVAFARRAEIAAHFNRPAP
jgi:acetoacetyl-CoA synthetase